MNVSLLSWRQRLHAIRFRLLFGSFISLLAAGPLAVLVGQRIVIGALFVVNVLAVGYAVARGRRHFQLLVVAAIAAVLVATFFHDDRLGLVRDGVLALVYLSFFSALVGHVLRARVVTIEEVFAALTGYLFLIMLFAALYGVITVTWPNSFANADSAQHTLLYFSMITQTALGYGDILPITPPARMLAGTQAIIGQLYLGVLVARLVGMQLASRDLTD